MNNNVYVWGNVELFVNIDDGCIIIMTMLFAFDKNYKTKGKKSKQKYWSSS